MLRIIAGRPALARVTVRMRFLALPTDPVRALRAGAPDAHGRPAERARSDGEGNPCRHCLAEIPAGGAMLIAAWRPFASLQPYAETGPVFLCGDDCERHAEARELPAMFAGWPRLLARGYSADERIVYGTGEVRDTGELIGALARMFEDPTVAFAHLRSASNNCYQCRVER